MVFGRGARRKPEREEVFAINARHEACHAIVALSHKIPVESVDILPEGPYGGCTRWKILRPVIAGADSPAYRADLGLEGLTVMVAALVGMRDFDENLAVSCSKDLQDARQLASELIESGTRPSAYEGPWSVDSLLEHAQIIASATIERFEDFVEFLTQELRTSRGERKLGRSVLNPLISRMEQRQRELNFDG